MKDPAFYEAPSCRILEIRMDSSLLAASNEDIPIDPFDPEF